MYHTPETSLSEVIKTLAEEGYTIDFNRCGSMPEHCDEVKDHQSCYLIDKIFRFEGMTDPEDEAVLYAISSKDRKSKGTLVNGYGIYADDAASELVKKLLLRENGAF